MAKKDKKWSLDKCEIEFLSLEGKMSERVIELSKRSKLSEPTIWRYYRKGNWKQKVEDFDRDMIAAVTQKTIDKTSDRLSDELAKLNEEHIKGSELFRKMAQQFAGILATEIQNCSPEDRVKKLTNKEFTLAINRYANVFATAVALQRQATGMQYLDINTAIEQVTRNGYEVSEPDN